VHLRLQSDSLSFHPVHTQIRAFGPRDLHHAKGRGLTDELYCRQKHPFMAPPVAATSGTFRSDPLMELCEEIVRSPSLADQPFIDQTKACIWIDGLQEADAEAAQRGSFMLIRIATLSLMQQRFGIVG
jgi:asparagine synthase (glutamine-hydrolysing)